MKKAIPTLLAVAALAFTGCTAEDRETAKDAWNQGKEAWSQISEAATAPTGQASGSANIGGDGYPLPHVDTPVTNPSEALAVLQSIPVAEESSKERYDREAQFGAAWIDVDKNGCKTRDDILARDLTDVKTNGKDCTVVSGVLNDPYSGETIEFKKSMAIAVQIDHIIPLKQAWVSGAEDWSQEARIAFANDPGNLIAVKGRENTSKSDKDIARWVPTNTDYLCQYATDQVRVKNQWGLTMDANEYRAAEGYLKGCV